MMGLPKKELLRIDEVATYFSVTDRTIRLWIQHGHLKAEKIVGCVRITRASALNCRFASMVEDEPVEEDVPVLEKRKYSKKMEVPATGG